MNIHFAPLFQAPLLPLVPLLLFFLVLDAGIPRLIAACAHVLLLKLLFAEPFLCCSACRFASPIELDALHADTHCKTTQSIRFLPSSIPLCLYFQVGLSSLPPPPTQSMHSRNVFARIGWENF